jgi:hypothetical protein
MRNLLLPLLLTLTPPLSEGGQAVPAAAPAPAPSPSPEADDPLARFKFGGSVGLSVDRMGGDPVSDAEVVNGVVRAKTTASSRPRVLLEVHRPFITFSNHNRLVKNRGSRSITTVNTAGWGIGPFVAVQSGGNSAIDGLAAGVMFSILRDSDTGADFNIGAGAMLDGKVKYLGDGIVDGKPLPAGETAVRFKEKAGWSFVLLFSVGQ